MSQQIVQEVRDQLFLEMMQYVLACRNLGRGAIRYLAADALMSWQKVSRYRHFDLLETTIIVMKDGDRRGHEQAMLGNDLRVIT